jgi:hypothetical protein
MIANIRNKTILPDHLDDEQIGALFSQIEQHPDKPQSKRIERILGLLSRLGGKPSKEEARRVTTQLRNALNKYRWVFQVPPTAQGYRAVALPAPSDSGETSPDEPDGWEYGAVRVLLDLTLVAGGLSRLKRCAYEGCKSWFYAANRKDQKFCTSGLCRQSHYYSDPEHQKKHRAAVAKYDADQRERDKKAIESARRALNT